MLWVTFARADNDRNAVAVGANIKDENYFAVRDAPMPQKRPHRGANLREMASASLFRALGRRTRGYCLVPLKVPSPNVPNTTFPLMEFPSTFPVYFTARVCPCASILYSIVTSSPLTVPVTWASPS